jgi:RNA polymerase sigma-70 factor (ECF subfamily)
MRAGDKNVAAAFYDRVRPQIDRTLIRLFGHRDADHDDLRQLALIEIVFTLHRFRGECSLDAWVGTLTGHVVFKHLRRRQTEARLFGVLDREDLLPASAYRTAREPLIRSLMRRASRHLEAMPSDKSWVFMLHDLLGYDLKEVAQIVGVSVSAAQTRLVRGRRDLNDRIAADPELAGMLEQIGDWP